MSKFEKVKKRCLQWWPYVWSWLVSMAICSIPFPLIIKINNMMPPVQKEFLGEVKLPNIVLFIIWVVGVIFVEGWLSMELNL